MISKTRSKTHTRNSKNTHIQKRHIQISNSINNNQPKVLTSYEEGVYNILFDSIPDSELRPDWRRAAAARVRTVSIRATSLACLFWLPVSSLHPVRCRHLLCNSARNKSDWIHQSKHKPPLCRPPPQKKADTAARASDPTAAARCWRRRPVRAKITGAFALSALEGKGGRDSPQTLVTTIVRADFGGWLSPASVFFQLGWALGLQVGRGARMV